MARSWAILENFLFHILRLLQVMLLILRLFLVKLQVYIWYIYQKWAASGLIISGKIGKYLFVSLLV